MILATSGSEETRRSSICYIGESVMLNTTSKAGKAQWMTYSPVGI